MQRAIDGFKFNTPTPYTARYVGSMVADIHRTLMYGGKSWTFHSLSLSESTEIFVTLIGIYLYPADAAKVTKLLLS